MVTMNIHKKAYRRVVMFFILLSANLTIRGQIMGYESPAEIPMMSIYNRNAMVGYIAARRQAYYEDLQLRDQMQPIIDDLYNRYDAGKYQECINIISDIFQTYTFYTRQKGIYSPLYYIRWMSYIALGDETNGFSNLVCAKDANNNSAYQVLLWHYSNYVIKARQELNNRMYNNCLSYISKALSTSINGYEMFEIGGQALEAQNRFDDAKKYYKLANESGSSKANELLSNLKKHKKMFQQQG